MKATRTFILCLLLLICQIAYAAAQTSSTFKIAIFPRRDASATIKAFTPLAEYLEKVLQTKVSLRTAADFDAFNRLVEQEKPDLVHMNQFQYIHMHESMNYLAIAQNEELGESRIRGAIFAHRDSGINDMNDLKGKKIIFGGGPEAMMSYIVPVYLLQKAGLDKGDYESAFAINPPNAVIAVFLKQVDAAGAGEIISRHPVVSKRIDQSQLKILKKSLPLPHLPWAMSADQPSGLRHKVQSLLTQLNYTEEGREILKKAKLTAINPANDFQYDAHRRIIDFVKQSEKQERAAN